MVDDRCSHGRADGCRPVEDIGLYGLVCRVTADLGRSSHGTYPEPVGKKTVHQMPTDLAGAKYDV